mgnify:CR=1 FL=1
MEKIRSVKIQKSMLIIINGCPSSGKTSASKEFIETSDDLFLYQSYDSFMETLPSKYFSTSPNEGFYAKEYCAGGYQIIRGEIGNKIFLQSVGHIKSLLLEGFNVVFDIVESDKEILSNMIDDFSKICPIKSFYLYADNQVISNRQRSRSDREIDLTKFFIDQMKDIGQCHDFSVDTSKMDPLNISYFIKNRI